MGEQDVDVNIPTNIQWVIVGVCAVILVVMGFYSTTIGDSVRDDVRILESEVTQLTNDLQLKRHAEQEVRNEVIYQTTGIHPETVRLDKVIAQDYLNPAFTWVSGEEYNEARTLYIDRLGESNPFVDTYLAPNLEVDGHNYIDLHELKSQLRDIEMYALNSVDNTMEYLAVVNFVMYNEAAELAAQNNAPNSKALIKLTVVGSGDDRTVFKVDAKPGFSVVGQ